jgi:hypothetical protein
MKTLNYGIYKEKYFSKIKIKEIDSIEFKLTLDIHLTYKIY